MRIQILHIANDLARTKVTEAMLRSGNCDCDIAGLNGKDVEIGHLYRFDLILFDLTDCPAGGYNVLLRLRASRINTPIMLVSEMSEPEHKIRGLGFDARDHLCRPFGKRELLTRVHECIRRSRADANPPSPISTSLP